MKVIGIDPGKKGIAVLTDSQTMTLDFHKFKFDQSNNIDHLWFNVFMNKHLIDHIIIEKVHGRGGVWGATQNFNFGFIYSQILSCVTRNYTSYTLVEPKTWQSVIHEGIQHKSTAKIKTMSAYKRLCPENPLIECGSSTSKIDENLIDAFMISLYGQIKYAKLSGFAFKYKV
jgi:hypothetical protein